MKNIVMMMSLLLLGSGGLTGCATSGSSSQKKTYDSAAKERAKPYLKDVISHDFRYASTSKVCPKVSRKDVKTAALQDWKELVLTAGACVEAQSWQQVESFGGELASRFVDAPWGAYFLALAASARGETLRAYWMLDLTERKAGGPVALAQYERARLLEKEEGPASAARLMKEAVKLDPKMIAAQLWLAEVYHRDQLLDQAEEHYRMALSAKSGLYPALVGLGDVMLQKHKGAEAVELLSQAVSIKPDVIATRVQLASAYETLLGEPGKALSTLRDLQLSIARGRTHGTLGFDISKKISELEKGMRPVKKEQAQESLPPRQPAEQKKGG